MPHGLNAIIASRFGRAGSVYVMIGGPIEWEGGGLRADNKVLSRLNRPSHVVERLLLTAARRATVVVTMGSRARETMLSRGFDPARVVAIPASVDESRFRPRRAQLEWDVITVAALIPRKQLHDLLDAIARLRPTRPHIRVAIVGTGDLLGDLQRRAGDAGISSNVHFLGFREDVEELYARSRLFVLTSRDEGLPIALLEAMTSGLPVVVSDVGEVRDAVEDERNGYVFPAGDVDELTRLLGRLLDDPNLARRLGEHAAKDVLGHVGRPAVAAAYGRIFNRG